MITTKDIDKILKFQTDADRQLFIAIFGDNVGWHLWSKFVSSNHNFTSFVRNLDTQNLKRLLKHLNQK